MRRTSSVSVFAGLTLAAHLVLTFPAVLWLARAFADRPRAEAVRLALRTVDDNFGFNPLLGSGRQKFALRLLLRRGELTRLVAWYGRAGVEQTPPS
jgi:lysine-N-methylase